MTSPEQPDVHPPDLSPAPVPAESDEPGPPVWVMLPTVDYVGDEPPDVRGGHGVSSEGDTEPWGWP